MNDNVILDRLAANIIHTPYASHGRIDGFFSHAHKVKRDAALQMQLLQINGPRCVRYLTFDIDRRFGALAWEDANLPIPNIISTNPANGHAHLIYELEKPIWLRRKDDPRPGEALAVRYLKAVQKAMGDALKADPHYNGLLVKNPFHASWTTTCARVRPYTLGELSAHLDLTSMPTATLKETSDSRNCTLFDSIRFWAYRAKSSFDDIHSFKDCLFAELDRLNDTLPFPLPQQELKYIGRSVSDWVWNVYSGNGSHKRRGIMCLDPSDPINVRQQQGQAFTCRIRREKTEGIIRGSINSLLREGIVVSISEVHRRTKLSRNTISAYWNLFSDLLTEKFTYETESLRDKYHTSLRSEGASPRQVDTLIPTELSIPQMSTYQEVMDYYKDSKLPIIKAIGYALKQAKLGILLSDCPKTFESIILSAVDKWREQRDIDEQRINYGTA